MSTFPPLPDSDSKQSQEARRESGDFGYRLEEKHNHDEKRLTQFLEFESKLSASQQGLTPRERYILFLEQYEYSLTPQERHLLHLGRRQAEAQHHS